MRLHETGAVDSETLEHARRDGFVIPRDSGPGRDHFTFVGHIDLPISELGVLRRIADLYYIRTCGKLRVSSAKRTAEQQAEAMYIKRYNRREAHYKNQKAYAEIRAAYDEGLRSHAGKDATVRAMAAVIKEQMKHGVYISRHLKGAAVDVLTDDMSQSQQETFEQVVDEVLGSGHWIRERSGHIHVQF